MYQCALTGFLIGFLFFLQHCLIIFLCSPAMRLTGAGSDGWMDQWMCETQTEILKFRRCSELSLTTRTRTLNETQPRLKSTIPRSVFLPCGWRRRKNVTQIHLFRETPLNEAPRNRTITLTGENRKKKKQLSDVSLISPHYPNSFFLSPGACSMNSISVLLICVALWAFWVIRRSI